MRLDAAARIGLVAFADIIEAMWAHRLYRASLGTDAAIENGAAFMCDAAVVEAR